MKTLSTIALLLSIVTSTSGANFDFEDTPFHEALREVVFNHNSEIGRKEKRILRVFIDSNVDMNRKVTLSLHDLSTERVIEFICGQANYPFVVKENYIFILGVEGLISKMPDHPLPELKVVHE